MPAILFQCNMAGIVFVVRKSFCCISDAILRRVLPLIAHKKAVSHIMKDSLLQYPGSQIVIWLGCFVVILELECRPDIYLTPCEIVGYGVLLVGHVGNPIV